VLGVTATAVRPETGWRVRHPWGVPAVVGAVVAAGTAYTAWQDPNREGGLFPGCPLRELTGLDCPGCGGTRALHALTHGDIGTALDHNVVIAVLLPLLLVAWGLWLARTIQVTRAQRRDEPRPPLPGWVRPNIDHKVWMGLIVGLFAFAIVRNISAVPVLDYLGSEA
jgi:hypothetical protein